jgi:hypothetical protein
MPYTAPAAVVSGATISKSTFGDVVIADLNFLANPPACRVYHNTTQSLTDITETTVAFNSERFDTDTMHDTVTNNSRITIKTAGIYEITANLEIAQSADYVAAYAYIRLNGATLIGIDGGPIASTSQGIRLNPKTLWKCAVNDYLEVRAYQDNTANAARNIAASNVGQADFMAVWVGLG